MKSIVSLFPVLHIVLNWILCVEQVVWTALLPMQSLNIALARQTHPRHWMLYSGRAGNQTAWKMPVGNHRGSLTKQYSIIVMKPWIIASVTVILCHLNTCIFKGCSHHTQLLFWKLLEHFDYFEKRKENFQCCNGLIGDFYLKAKLLSTLWCVKWIYVSTLTLWGWVMYICIGKPTIMVQIMACRLVGTKPLSEPILEYC